MDTVLVNFVFFMLLPSLMIIGFVTFLWRCSVNDLKFWRSRAEYYQDKSDEYRFKWLELYDNIRGDGPHIDCECEDCLKEQMKKELEDNNDDPADYWKNN